MKQKLDITEYRLKAPVDRPFLAAFVSDTHGEDPSVWLGESDKRNPDIFLIPGDITDRHNESPACALELLGELTKRAPVFMSLGNHERMSADFVREAAEQTGAVLLEDAYTEYNGIKIGGLTSGYVGEPGRLRQGHFRKTPPPNIGFAKEFAALDGYKLLLSHHPEYYPRYLSDLDISLILSGHAHGGQWRIFGHPFFAPDQAFFPKYAQGFHDGKMIVSRGLANNGPAPRFGNRRELIFISFEKE
ncbi:MAG: metallophosphoesterase [Clostridia bacterium]|nr:metallophosphoesterase [Clostridia bacterium]